MSGRHREAIALEEREPLFRCESGQAVDLKFWISILGDMRNPVTAHGPGQPAVADYARAGCWQYKVSRSYFQTEGILWLHLLSMQENAAG